jgi:hypothetical protein
MVVPTVGLEPVTVAQTAVRTVGLAAEAAWAVRAWPMAEPTRVVRTGVPTAALTVLPVRTRWIAGSE